MTASLHTLHPAAVVHGLMRARAPAPLVRFPARPLATDGDDMLLHIPIRSSQADAAAAARLEHEATHAKRRAEYEAMFNLPMPYARSNVPPSQLTEAEQVTVTPPRQFARYELGGRPADDMPALLTKRGVFTAGGVVLILAAGWLGGVISTVMVL